MKIVWRHQWIISLILGLLAIPVYFLDAALTGKGGGGWITLNFRGLIVWTYVALVTIHLVLTTLAVPLFPRLGTVPRQLAALLMSGILLAGGFYGWVTLVDMNRTRQIRALQEQRAPLARVIELKEWSFFPDEIHPTEIRVKVMVHAAGRFAGNVEGSDLSATGDPRFVFQSVNDPSTQRQVGKDEAFTYVFPLQFLQPERATDVRITLYLFEREAGPSVRDISKVFMNSPIQPDDGTYFYGTLPPPARR